MSSPDLPLRERVKRLTDEHVALFESIYARLGLIESALIPGNTAYNVPYTTVQTGNYSLFDGITVNPDASGQAGLFIKTTGAVSGVNGTDFVIDSVGTKFNRLRLV